jgi:hypothetical protein
MKTYEELQAIMHGGLGGTASYHIVNPFVRAFIVTNGVKYFADEAAAHWLLDVVASYIPKIARIYDSFFVPMIQVNETHEGIFKISREIPDGENMKKKIVVKQNIQYVDLPVGEYKFFLCRNGKHFVMMCPSEY